MLGGIVTPEWKWGLEMGTDLFNPLFQESTYPGIVFIKQDRQQLSIASAILQFELVRKGVPSLFDSSHM
jgi:hypothetical protein